MKLKIIEGFKIPLHLAGQRLEEVVLERRREWRETLRMGHARPLIGDVESIPLKTIPSLSLSKAAPS